MDVLGDSIKRDCELKGERVKRINLTKNFFGHVLLSRDSSFISRAKKLWVNDPRLGLLERWLRLVGEQGLARKKIERRRWFRWQPIAWRVQERSSDEEVWSTKRMTARADKAAMKRTRTKHFLSSFHWWMKKKTQYRVREEIFQSVETARRLNGSLLASSRQIFSINAFH